MKQPHIWVFLVSPSFSTYERRPSRRSRFVLRPADFFRAAAHAARRHPERMKMTPHPPSYLALHQTVRGLGHPLPKGESTRLPPGRPSTEGCGASGTLSPRERASPPIPFPSPRGEGGESREAGEPGEGVFQGSPPALWVLLRRTVASISGLVLQIHSSQGPGSWDRKRCRCQRCSSQPPGGGAASNSPSSTSRTCRCSVQ